MVELLSTTLSGGRSGFEVSNPHDKAVMPAGVSHLFVAFYPKKFSGLDVAQTTADRISKKIENSKPREKSAPRLPGSRANAAAHERWQQGIPLTVDLIASLQEAAALSSPQKSRSA
jgi:LDH2 family malate/lactate/ureidoglycolate dehydrogenase